MKKITMSLFGFVIAVALGTAISCGGNDGNISGTTDPVKLGTLAATIESVTPGEADQLLSEAGHVEGSFREAVEEIMADPDRAVKFSAAYNKARG